MYTLCSKITIGHKNFAGINEVRVSRSVHAIGATATIKVPASAVLRQEGLPPAYIETAQMIRVGDKVEIQLGYDERFRTEFRGYVRQIDQHTPLSIICEDEFFQTRTRMVTIEKKTSLTEVLKACQLDVAKDIPLTLDAFPVDNKSVAWVLGRLQTDYGLAIWFDLDGRVHATRPNTNPGEEVKYRLRWNVVKDDELKFRLAEDSPLKIKAVNIDKKGVRTTVEVGDKNSAEKTLYFYDVADEKQLKELAQTELERYSYDGYAGKITTFLEPYAQPGMVARIEDQTYPERSGRSYIESVETTYGTGGARRTLEIGIKL